MVILSLSFTSINGKNLAETSLPDFHSNTAFSDVVIVVSILDTPTPTISLTYALKPEPFVSVSSKLVKSPTLYPSPPLRIVNPSTIPFVTDSILVNCLISS